MYSGNFPLEDKGLIVGGFESVFVADFVATYLL